MLALIAACCLVGAAAQGNGCEQTPCDGVFAMCNYPDECCGGVCRVVQDILTAGNACGVTPCQVCRDPLQCIGGICQLKGRPVGCTNACTQDDDCNPGLSCLSSGRCGYANLGYGAKCGIYGECVGGLTCTSGVCVGSPADAECTLYPSPLYWGSLFDTCDLVTYCNGTHCRPRLTSGFDCTGANPKQCATDSMCNVDSKCADPGTKAVGEPCSNAQFCVSTAYCDLFSTHQCVAKGALNDPCTFPGTWSGECSSGLCSTFDNMNYRCMDMDVLPGADCYNSDQCIPGSSGCIFDDPVAGPGSHGVCGPDGAACASVADCGNHYYDACVCDSTSWDVPGALRCKMHGTLQPNSQPAYKQNCTLSLNSASLGYLDWRAIAFLGTTAQQNQVAEYLCCLGCTSDFETRATSLALMLPGALDCSTNTFVPYTPAAIASRCSGNATTPSSVSDILTGACPVGVVSASVTKTRTRSRSPSPSPLSASVSRSPVTGPVSVSPSVSPSPASPSTSASPASDSQTPSPSASAASASVAPSKTPGVQSNTSSDSDTSALSPDRILIIGVAGGGGLLALVLIIIVVVVCRRRSARKKRNRAVPSNATASYSEAATLDRSASVAQSSADEGPRKNPAYDGSLDISDDDHPAPVPSRPAPARPR